MKEREGEDDTLHDSVFLPLHSESTRVLPVFVLSLKDPPDELVLHNRELMAYSKQAVVVLQTVTLGAQSFDNKWIFSGHLVDGERVRIPGGDSTRHIIAGLASALAGEKQNAMHCLLFFAQCERSNAILKEASHSFSSTTIDRII